MARKDKRTDVNHDMPKKTSVNRFLSMTKNFIVLVWHWVEQSIALCFRNIVGFLRIRYHWLILILFAAALTGFFLLQWFGPDAPTSTDAYLLSAIAQSIAALFAVVFTITVIVLQVGYRFRGILGEFLKDPFNLVYPLLNSIGIVFPLIILRIECYGTWSNVAVALAGFCVFLVVVFFLRIKDFLTYNVGVRELLRQSHEALDTHDAMRYKGLLSQIAPYANGAVFRRKFIVVEEIVHGLLDLIVRAYDIQESLAFSPDVHKRHAFHGITHNTFKEFCIYIQLATDIGILKDVFYDLLVISEITDYMPNMNVETYKTIAESLIDVTKSAKGDIKKVACCAVWVFSSKWLSINEARSDIVTQVIQKFATSVGREFVLSCNDEHGPHEIYENAAWRLRAKDRKAHAKLGILRSIIERM